MLTKNNSDDNYDNNDDKDNGKNIHRNTISIYIYIYMCTYLMKSKQCTATSMQHMMHVFFFICAKTLRKLQWEDAMFGDDHT